MHEKSGKNETESGPYVILFKYNSSFVPEGEQRPRCIHFVGLFSGLECGDRGARAIESALPGAVFIKARGASHRISP